jgi:hypothetical protein
MKKIQTIFERDWDGDRSRVLTQPVAGCEWVFAGEGVATRKYDGTAIAVIEGNVYKRHEVRAGKEAPPTFLTAGYDEETGKHVGWVLAGDGPEDKWLRQAVPENEVLGFPATSLEDGTYELVGPKVQGNPEQYPEHTLVKHLEAETYIVYPRTYENIRDLLSELDIEGFVFHHPDGRMAKIKKRDFGLKRVKP